MKERLNELIEKKGLTATKFANMIDVNPSAISHLLKGRNKPGYDVLVNIARVFPDISMDWLLMGKGKMLVSESVTISDGSETVVQQSEKSKAKEEKATESEIAVPAATKGIATALPDITPGKTVERIVLFFTDGSFEDYTKG